MSFSPLAVRRVHDLAPALPTVLLLEVLPRWLQLGRLPFGARIAGPGIGLLRARPQLLPALRRRRQPGVRLDRQRAGRPGAGARQRRGGIITDRPALVLARLGR